MKRPVSVVIVNILQVLLGLSLVGITVYLLYLTRSRQTLAEPDSKEAVHGLLIGALVLGIPAVITLIGAAGLWKGKFWGWVLSFATDVGMLGVMIYNIIDDYEFDAEMVAVAVGLALPIVLLLVPGVRRDYWPVKTSAVRGSAA